MARTAKKKVTLKSKPEAVTEFSGSKVPTIADKKYIFDNYQKLPDAEIAKNTGLTEEQVHQLINSTELDNSPVAVPKKGPRRYGKVGNAIVMTEAQAILNDRAMKAQAPIDMKEKYGDDFHYIEIKEPKATPPNPNAPT